MNWISRDIYRLFDANLNRAVEGVRVLEDTVRMLLDNHTLTERLKQIRHELVSIPHTDPRLSERMLLERGSDRDVLRNGETVSEHSRPDVIAIVRANAGRAQEAVRVMEEYSKLFSEGMSVRFKTMRFSLYDIEQDIVVIFRKHDILTGDKIKVFVIFDVSEEWRPDSSTVKRAYDFGADLLCISDRMSSDSGFISSTTQVKETCDKLHIPLFTAGRLDCALTLDACGVVLGHDDLPVEACRKIGGPGLLVGMNAVFSESAMKEMPLAAPDFLLLSCVPTSEYVSSNEPVRKSSALFIEHTMSGKLQNYRFDGVFVQCRCEDDLSFISDISLSDNDRECTCTTIETASRRRMPLSRQGAPG